jgi:hypothetical protein
MAEARELCGVQVLLVHPYPKRDRFARDMWGMGRGLNELSYGPQEYAVIGHKS